MSLNEKILAAQQRIEAAEREQKAAKDAAIEAMKDALRGQAFQGLDRMIRAQNGLFDILKDLLFVPHFEATPRTAGDPTDDPRKWTFHASYRFPVRDEWENAYQWEILVDGGELAVKFLNPRYLRPCRSAESAASARRGGWPLGYPSKASKNLFC